VHLEKQRRDFLFLIFDSPFALDHLFEPRRERSQAFSQRQIVFG
jgi:hypothetical protein